MRAVLVIGIHREELAFGEAVAAGLDLSQLALLRIPAGVSGVRPSQDQAFYYRTNHQELYLQLLAQVRGHYDLLLDLHAGVNEPGRCADLICADRHLLACLLDQRSPAQPPPSGELVRGVLLAGPDDPPRVGDALLSAHTVIPRSVWDNAAFRYLGIEVFLPAAGAGLPADWTFARRLIEQALVCAGARDPPASSSKFG
jgi:hypothetical protein